MTADQRRNDNFCKAAVMGVHEIERDLDRVESESARICYFQHVQVHTGIFVTCKPDVSDFAGIACLDEGGVRSGVRKNAMRVLVPKYFMMLHEVDALDSETREGFLQLFGRFFLGGSINFRHDKCLFAVAIA